MEGTLPTLLKTINPKNLLNFSTCLSMKAEDEVCSCSTNKLNYQQSGNASKTNDKKVKKQGNGIPKCRTLIPILTCS